MSIFIKSSCTKPFAAFIALFLLFTMDQLSAQTKNPFAGSKTAFMHDDVYSSDVFSGTAPSNRLNFRFETKQGAVPTILLGKDGFLQVICVRNESTDGSIQRTPYLLLVNPQSMETLTSLKLPAGTALNNIYGYLNENDELMLANGKTIYQIAHIEKGKEWKFNVKNEFKLDSVSDDFEFVGITPDWEGNIWFASYDSQAGFLNPKNSQFSLISLSDTKEEIVANSISSSPAGTAIATSHAIYVLHLKNKKPEILWKADYNRGTKVKPGQLSWGTGSSPTFFGPKSGFEYLTLLDNGTEGTRLNIYCSENGNLIASELAFKGDQEQASENSSIAFGNSVIIASTYGFPYPASSSATDEKGVLKNGVQRFDVNTDGRGAKSVWYNEVMRSTSVPKMGKDSGKIHFISEDGEENQFYAELDFNIGKVIRKEKIDIDPNLVLPNAAQLSAAQKNDMLKRIGNPFNAMQMAGLFDGNGVLYQGTKLGILKISSVKTSGK